MATTYEYFKFNNTTYKKGTKLRFNGEIEKCPDIHIMLKNEEVTFLYTKQLCRARWFTYVKYNNEVYWCEENEFLDGIISVGVVKDSKTKISNNESLGSAKEYVVTHEEKSKEIIWDDWMVAKTLWYIVIMFVATIFHERIGIWILATVIWWYTTIQNAPRV